MVTKMLTRMRSHTGVVTDGRLRLFRPKRDLVEVGVCLGVIALAVWLSISAGAAHVLSTASGMSQAAAAEWLMTIRTAAIWFLVPNILVVAGRQHVAGMALVWVLAHALPVYGVTQGLSIVDLLIEHFYWTGINIMMLPVFYFLTFLRSETFALISAGRRIW